jgi:hypothetical protein
MIDSMSNQRIMVRRHCFGISSLVQENGFVQGAEYFMPSVGDEIPSRCGDCYGISIGPDAALALVLLAVLEQPQRQEREHRHLTATS